MLSRFWHIAYLTVNTIFARYDCALGHFRSTTHAFPRIGTVEVNEFLETVEVIRGVAAPKQNIWTVWMQISGAVANLVSIVVESFGKHIKWETIQFRTQMTTFPPASVYVPRVVVLVAFVKQPINLV